MYYKPSKLAESATLTFATVPSTLPSVALKQTRAFQPILRGVFGDSDMAHETEGHHQLRVHIDRRDHESPNPTTGDALYALGKVHEHHHLYREAHGNHEDQQVPRGQEAIQLVEDEHFYSAEDHQKGIRIIVNAREEIVYHHRLSYEQVVKLAYPTPPSPEVIGYIVTYYKGPEHHEQGDLTEGKRVRIRNGMIFNVTPTNRS